MSAAQLLLRAFSAFALSTSMVVVAQAPSPAAPAAAPAGAPSASSHNLKPDEVENIHANSKVATHNAKVAQASLEHAQNAFQFCPIPLGKLLAPACGAATSGRHGELLMESARDLWDRCCTAMGNVLQCTPAQLNGTPIECCKTAGEVLAARESQLREEREHLRVRLEKLDQQLKATQQAIKESSPRDNVDAMSYPSKTIDSVMPEGKLATAAFGGKADRGNSPQGSSTPPADANSPLPVPQNTELVGQEGLEGEWINDGQVNYLYDSFVTFPSGETVAVEPTSDTTCHMTLEGTAYYGRMSPCRQKLLWSDGDVWIRKPKEN